MTSLEEIDFSKLDGLAAVVVQDNSTSDVLMVGFMNEEAYLNTLQTGLVTFYSRSRNKQWVKGESSGHTLQVVSLRTDATRVIKAVFSACEWEMNGLLPNNKPFHQKTSTEEQNDTEIRNSKRKFGKRNNRSIPPRGLSDHCE
jgi:phosphoribosyl-AMP cyclohydrolase